MELLEAIATRKSVRGYKPTPVPREVLAELLRIAVRSPSGLNTQPWEIVVLTGKALDEVKRTNAELLEAGAPITADISSERPTGIYRDRQVAVAKQLFQLKGIAREDRAKRDEWDKKQARFLDAPAAIVVAIDKVNYPRAVMDAGLLVQTLALSALHFGLGTCIQQASVNYPDVIRRVAHLPESKMIVIGVAIGYPDWADPANRVKTEREPLENVVTWCQ